MTVHGVAGSIYPTPIRANGMGWALGIGKIGSIAGPFIGGLLLLMALSVSQLFWAAAVPIAVVTVAAFFLMKIYDRTVHADGAPSVVEPATPHRPELSRTEKYEKDGENDSCSCSALHDRAKFSLS